MKNFFDKRNKPKLKIGQIVTLDKPKLSEWHDTVWAVKDAILSCKKYSVQDITYYCNMRCSSDGQSRDCWSVQLEVHGRRGYDYWWVGPSCLKECREEFLSSEKPTWF
jgi:hypothetical protein